MITEEGVSLGNHFDSEAGHCVVQRCFSSESMASLMAFTKSSSPHPHVPSSVLFAIVVT